MIAMLTGTLVEAGASDAVIRVGGVGYRFQASSRCLARLGGRGAEATVLVDTQVRDDRIVLTGFADASERDAFTLLQTVQGVGVKAALAVLSALAPDDLILAVSAGDKAMVARAEGVGPKLAQRIINELGDKVAGVQFGAAAAAGDGADPGRAAALNDAVSALVNLGYGRSEAHAAVALALQGAESPALETVLPQALKELGR